jgi:hypothetical protein
MTGQRVLVAGVPNMSRAARIGNIINSFGGHFMDHFYMISKKLSVGEALLLDIIKSLLI